MSERIRAYHRRLARDELGWYRWYYGYGPLVLGVLLCIGAVTAWSDTKALAAAAYGIVLVVVGIGVLRHREWARWACVGYALPAVILCLLGHVEGPRRWIGLAFGVAWALYLASPLFGRELAAARGDDLADGEERISRPSR